VEEGGQTGGRRENTGEASVSKKRRNESERADDAYVQAQRGEGEGKESGRGGGETQTDKRGGTDAAVIDDAVQAEQASWRTRHNVQQKTHGPHGEQEEGADAEGHQRYN
jgi:hypothetical protein